MNVSKEAREAANRLDDALGFLTEIERPIVLEAFAKFEAEITQRVRDEALEEAAAFVEGNVLVQSTDDRAPSYFSKRRGGNIHGLEYAAAIRQMIGGKA
ncbi:hypothetical protein [Sphingobium sp. CFD-1]|uniref:hypothetical protein n=1 Tax=Sphingobium sp. CFD-1 TaxID=2878545 RepID=UPI00214D0D61|nr:hypothetical protein [Sphingobium sp. CFD-1]